MKQWIKKWLAPGLMLLSILLLAAFQLFWLQKVYEEQYQLLRKETGSLLADAVRGVEDSLVQRWVLEQLPQSRDSFKIKARQSPESDPLVRLKAGKSSHIIIQKQSINAEISEEKKIFRFRADSLPNKEWVPGFLQSVFLKVQVMDSTGLFISSPIDSNKVWEQIRRAYADSLEQARMDMAFGLLVNDSLKATPANQLLTAEVSSILPGQYRYQAALSGYRPYLLRKIGPQLLFSLFLLALTTASFLLLYRNMQRQQRLAEMRSGLVSNITHELKTPIATVSVALEAMESFNALQDQARTREYLDMSRNELNRLSLLIDKVLKAAAFENGGLEMHPEWIDLKQLLEEVTTYMKLQFEKQQAQVSLSFSGEDFRLRADRTHLANVIYNLIDNALKYSKENPVIELELKNNAAVLEFSVQDQGIGIPPEYQKRIFDKFFRVPRGDEHDTKGYGLGLNYVARVVEKHGGSIRLSSRENEGSRFTLTLARDHERH